METIVSKITHTTEDDAIIKKAGEIIRLGGLVAFPTETVYGLGADARKLQAKYMRQRDVRVIIH